MKKRTNTTGMLTVAMDSLNTKPELVTKGYEFGWMDCARFHRTIKAKTNAQLKTLFSETLENRNNSFDSLYTILEYLMNPANTKIFVHDVEGEPHVLNYNTQVLRRIFNGEINGYKVLDHIMDRAYKYL